jgi:hypothetical protein
MSKKYKVPEEILTKLIAVCVSAIGKEKTHALLGLDEGQQPQLDPSDEISGTIHVIDSFDELAEFIVTNVTDKVTLASGLELTKSLSKVLLPLDELPEVGYIDDCLVLSWYAECSYGFSLVMNGEEVVLMQRGDDPVQLHADEELVNIIQGLMFKVNYEGIVH